jgi:hypothetical protein
MRRVANSLFVAATFASAFVLFVMQPFAARTLLPRYGGAPHVWVTTAVFFQVAVLLGYGYAHLAPKRLSPRALTFVHTALAASVVVSFRRGALLDASVAEGRSPIVGLFLALLGSVFGPALFLAATSPLVQLLLARSKLRPNPYSLYVASNGGSLLALLAYPFLVDPLLGLRAQSAALHGALAVAAVCIAGATLVAHRISSEAHPNVGEAAADATPLPSARIQARWFVLAFAPSLLLSAMTLHVTTDVAAIPLFWVAPLGLYLVSFMVAFGRYGKSSLPFFRRATLFFALLVVVAIHAKSTSFALLVPHAAFLFVATTCCHSLLAEARPDASHLTRFYVVMSLGGAAGGAMCSIVAPLLFRDLWEYPLSVVLIVWLVASGEAAFRPRDLLAIPVFAAAVAALGKLGAGPLGLTAGPLAALSFGLPMLAVYPLRGVRQPLALAGTLLAGAFLLEGNLLFHNRTFFGVLRVKENPEKTLRGIVSGTTSHGIEDRAHPEKPLAYYFRTGPAGDVFRLLGEIGAAQGEEGKRVFVVGLGIGALGGYAEKGDRFTFFELDPLDVWLARDSGLFGTLAAMKSPAAFLVGDARIQLEHLERGSPGKPLADLLVVDAFSSDMIPVHLLTREAMSLYARLSTIGILVHCSNQFANLVPVTAAAMASASLEPRVRVDLEIEEPERKEGKRASVWMFGAKAAATTQRLEATYPGWKVAKAANEPWTDDHTDVVSTLGKGFDAK